MSPRPAAGLHVANRRHPAAVRRTHIPGGSSSAPLGEAVADDDDQVPDQQSRGGADFNSEDFHASLLSHGR